MGTLRITSLALATLLLASGETLNAAESGLKINTDFPGGNALVINNLGNSVEIAPDMRTSKPWFYWYFEAEAAVPGPVTFILPPSNVGSRGAAFSTDDGKTWQWMGADKTTFTAPKGAEPTAPKQDSFVYNFTTAKQKVRFSVGIPYVQSNLDEFLKKIASNPNVKQSVLAKTNGDRPVELLQIGEPGEGKKSMAVSARSHACEALASYILEGFLDEAMSNSPAGEEFRKKYVLYAVPMLDKDGVQAGDQGKNRSPHDHNRDYGTQNLYPEVLAFQNLGAAKNFQVMIDFHCPALKGDIHDGFHWLGLKIPHMSDNADELSKWMSQERPQMTNSPLNVLAKPSDPPKLEGIPAAWFFAYQSKDALLSITLESPYAQCENVEVARNYGRGLLRALTHTELISVEPGSARGAGSYAALEALQKKLAGAVNRPEEAEAIANEVLKDPAAGPIFRAQANLGLATMWLKQKKYANALDAVKAAKKETGTMLENITAALMQIAIQTRNPDATREEVEAARAEFDALTYAANTQHFAADTDLAKYYESKGELPEALALEQKRVAEALARDRCGAMLRQAAVLDSMGKKDEAIALRKEVVARLKPILLPEPKGKSIFVGTNAGEFFEALLGIPEATTEEKVEAANVILNYPYLPAGVKEKATAWMKENGPKTGA
ncbi:hypothetical protein BH09VER1_BH09VER1_08100 [soil metagenome]